MLREGMDVPHDGYDEWYIFDEQSSPEWSPEVFVNIGAFTGVIRLGKHTPSTGSFLCRSASGSRWRVCVRSAMLRWATTT
jgi:hypothetical protein